MTHYETQTIEAFGVSYTEFRHEPDESDVQLVTIEFQPPLDTKSQYLYPHPIFTFGDMVAIRQQQESSLDRELDYFEISALELVKPVSESGELTAAPYWLYGLRCQNGTKEMLWYREEQLVSQRVVMGDFSEF